MVAGIRVESQVEEVQVELDLELRVFEIKNVDLNTVRVERIKHWNLVDY